jgi:hypothetical protein
MPELSTIYDYMRSYAWLLGERILEQFTGLQQAHDPLSPRIDSLLRKPFPAQAIAIMGVAKRWREARTGMVLAECGTPTESVILSVNCARYRRPPAPRARHPHLPGGQ